MFLVLERTQKIRTSNTRTLALPNFEHLELIPKNAGRTRTSASELRTSIEYEKFVISRHFKKIEEINCFWLPIQRQF